MVKSRYGREEAWHVARRCDEGGEKTYKKSSKTAWHADGQGWPDGVVAAVAPRRRRSVAPRTGVHWRPLRHGSELADGAGRFLRSRTRTWKGPSRTARRPPPSRRHRRVVVTVRSVAPMPMAPSSPPCRPTASPRTCRSLSRPLPPRSHQTAGPVAPAPTGGRQRRSPLQEGAGKRRH